MIPRPASPGQPAGSGAPAVLADGCVIACERATRPAGALLQSWLASSSGWQVSLADPDAAPAQNVIVLRLDDQLPAAEGYRLTAGDGMVTITGKAPAGVFYGVQTLRQLLPPEFLRTAAAGPVAPVTIPAAEIADQPRLAWRGVHIDVARHFLPQHWLLRLIDLLALHKLNVLHLHLTDDQGWRVQIERYPRLTEIGAWRRESVLGHSRDRRFDGVPHGGYYSRADLREIVAYAASRFITVVPEIDMPGHMQAAIAAYPELGNTGEQLEVRCRWGISSSVLNMEDATLEFCRNVLDEITGIFPGPYVHIGGDECPTAEWEASPRAQHRMAELGLTDERYLQGWFTGQMAGHLKSAGKTVVLWDEALESGAPAGAVIMPWRSELAGRYAAAAGYRVVMAPQYWTYFDWAQAAGDAEPVAMHATTSLRRVHAFEPAPPDLAAARDRVIGAQCQLWTEYVPTPQRAEYQYFPRLCAFAEVAWSPGSGDYGDFEQRLTGHLRRLDALGVNYRPLAGPAPGQARCWPDAAADDLG
ncbi:MAG TPA: beta-N-acetylhexosaminidase [Streptosporangiaceae bacterium]